jgi:uncharacterized protein YbjQ (UPF0145 family)
MSHETCPNCSSTIKDGLFNSNQLLAKTVSDVINAAQGTNTKGFCGKCGNDLFVTSLTKLKNELIEIQQTISESISKIPVISVHNPYKWEYEVIGLVTSQSVTGTGVFSEISMSLSDLFGSESGSMNKKIKDAEVICMTRLRKETWELGGNAIIAVDIDYSEVGSLRGMMMVCCTGTAIRVTNNEVFNAETRNALEAIHQIMEKHDRINAICKPYMTMSL